MTFIKFTNRVTNAVLLERKAQFYMKLEHPILSAKHTVKHCQWFPTCLCLVFILSNSFNILYNVKYHTEEKKTLKVARGNLETQKTAKQADQIVVQNKIT